MKKNKKNKAGKKNLLSGAAKSLKKLSKGTTSRLGGLSTTQKVVGGAALVALGWGYLANRRGKTAATTTNTAPDAAAAEESLAAMDESVA
ncbi:hypothetical protein IC235_06450 [Hymenobacter sp. BT664]|uniref:Uncharacterized protein n=1 Tax=Hymenobacter montanus TaxID=2771359 RepID=A0A927GIW2_9BACT|nr:hypothetical protein [Hymenobacter montanus]MBD2767529.1 hypothetical protein [Hymenobacter montanus]